MGKAVGMRVRGKYCNSQDLLFRIKVSFDLFFFSVDYLGAFYGF